MHNHGPCFIFTLLGTNKKWTRVNGLISRHAITWKLDVIRLSRLRRSSTAEILIKKTFLDVWVGKNDRKGFMTTKKSRKIGGGEGDRGGAEDEYWKN